MTPTIDEWLKQKHGDVYYNLTRFLTGQYLYRFKLGTSPDYLNCHEVLEDLEHAFFTVRKFVNRISNFEKTLDGMFQQENLVTKMLVCQKGASKRGSCCCWWNEALKELRERGKGRLNFQGQLPTFIQLRYDLHKTIKESRNKSFPNLCRFEASKGKALGHGLPNGDVPRRHRR